MFCKSVIEKFMAQILTREVSANQNLFNFRPLKFEKIHIFSKQHFRQVFVFPFAVFFNQTQRNFASATFLLNVHFRTNPINFSLMILVISSFCTIVF